MARKKTSKKPEAFSLDSFEGVEVKTKKGLTPFDPKKGLRNTKKVAQALVDCLLDGDEDAFKEILSAHLDLINKSKLSAKADVPLRTIQDAVSKRGNPRLSTLCSIFRGMSQDAG